MKYNIRNILGHIRQPAIFLIALLLCFSVASQAVFAAVFSDNSISLSCNSDGTVEKGSFFNPKLIYSEYAGGGVAGCGTVENGRFFSFLGCSFVSILNEVFSRFYCAVDYGMKSILMAVVTLFVVVIGFKILMGTQAVTRGATVGTMFKMGILLFLSGAGFFGSGMLFIFFSNIILNTIDWVASAVSCRTLNPADYISCVATKNFSDIFKEVDDIISTILKGGIDPTVSSGNVGGLFTQENELAMFFLGVLVFSPIFSGIIIAFILTVISFFVRTLVSLLMCLIVIAFLVCLTPLFLCFMLFGSTYSIFDNWLKFLIAYSIQPALTFAVFFIWLGVLAGSSDFLKDLQKVMVLKNNNLDTYVTITTDKEPMFCPIRYKTVPTTFDFFSLDPKINLGGTNVVCCKMIRNPIGDPIAVADPNYQVRICNPDEIANVYDIDKALKDGQAAINAWLADPANTGKTVYDAVNAGALGEDQLWYGDLQPLSKVISTSDFVSFLAYHIMSAFVITLAFLQIIKMTPRIAAEMSGSKSVMPLGANFGRGSGLHSLVSGFSNSIRSGARDQFEKRVPKPGTPGAPIPGTAPVAGVAMADTEPFAVGVGTRIT